MEEREVSYTVSKNVSYAATMESSMEVPQETESCHMIQQSHSWAYIRTKLQFKNIHSLLCL